MQSTLNETLRVEGAECQTPNWLMMSSMHKMEGDHENI